MLYLGPKYNPLVYHAKAIQTIDPDEYRSKYDYKPDAVLWDETYTYARYTQQILRGDLLGNTFKVYKHYFQGTYAYKEEYPFFYDRLGPAIMAILTAALGDIRYAFMIADFIFPALLAFLLLLFCWRQNQSLLFSILATSLFIWFNWTDTLNLVNMIRGGKINGELIFLRTPIPQVSEIIFVGHLIFLKIFMDRQDWKIMLVLSFSIFLNFMVYVYSWTLGVSIFFAAIAMHLINGIFDDSIWRRVAVRGGIALAIGLLMAFPAWSGYILSPEIIRDLSSPERIASVITHLPNLKWTGILLLSLMGLLLPCSGKMKTRRFWIIFWLGGIISINSQILLGKQIQPHHWVLYYFEPFLMIYLADLFWALLDNSIKRFSNIVRSKVMVVLVSVIFLIGFSQQLIRLSKVATSQLEYNHKDEKFEEIVDELRHWDSGYAILTSERYLNGILPAYVSQRFLVPICSDPMTNKELSIIEKESEKILGLFSGNELKKEFVAINITPMRQQNEGEILFDLNKIIIIINKHKANGLNIEGFRIVFENGDFEIAVPRG